MDHKFYASAAIVAVGIVSWLVVGVVAVGENAGSGAGTVEEGGLQQAQELRVCADPNNLPFSNRAEEGFHNRLAELFADQLGYSSVRYTWWPQRRGFVRNTLKQKKCDVIFGVPEGYDILQSTKPFYRSPYVFVYREDADFDVTSVDDPVLKDLKIGVGLIGDDYSNTPPAHVLSSRGLVGNVEGFPVYGDYDEDSPPKEIVLAVARGDIDVAMVWGPVAGYWAARQEVPLKMNPMPAVDDSTGLPLNFSMSLGVRRGEEEWQARLEKLIEENREEIYALLRDEYNVPLLPLEDEGSEPAAVSRADRETGPDTAAEAEPEPEPTDEAEPEPAAQDTTGVSETVYNGWKWMMVYCVRCHGETGTGSAIGPSLLAAVERQSFTRDSFIETVLEGRLEKGMPAWNELLDADQAAAIHEYIEARTEGLLAGRPERRSEGSSAEDESGGGR